jgi:hypothetical protein
LLVKQKIQPHESSGNRFCIKSHITKFYSLMPAW